MTYEGSFGGKAPDYREHQDQIHISEQQFLETYNAGDYERPSVTVDMLVFTIRSEAQENYRKLAEPELQLLLIRRGGHPYLGQWALPGGFVSMQESLEDAARRELLTETGLDDIYLEQLYTWEMWSEIRVHGSSAVPIWRWWIAASWSFRLAMMPVRPIGFGWNSDFWKRNAISMSVDV